MFRVISLIFLTSYIVLPNHAGAMEGFNHPVGDTKHLEIDMFKNLDGKCIRVSYELVRGHYASRMGYEYQRSKKVTRQKFDLNDGNDSTCRYMRRGESKCFRLDLEVTEYAGMTYNTSRRCLNMGPSCSQGPKFLMEDNSNIKEVADDKYCKGMTAR